MSFEKALAYLDQQGLGDRAREYEESCATVELAALAVGTEPARIAKTLSFLVDGKAILVVAAGDARVDNHAFKEAFHTKAKMIAHDEVELLVGHAPGGVCPFGVNSDVRTYIDESLHRFDVVYPACGSDNSAVRLAPDELERISEPGEWVDVCKGWRDEGVKTAG
jgi:prolyl-tRNA editing enzyme YbaK/EbsC (Cys-tRNA(Pro) deacylase)